MSDAKSTYSIEHTTVENSKGILFDAIQWSPNVNEVDLITRKGGFWGVPYNPNDNHAHYLTSAKVNWDEKSGPMKVLQLGQPSTRFVERDFTNTYLGYSVHRQVYRIDDITNDVFNNVVAPTLLLKGWDPLGIQSLLEYLRKQL